MDGQRDGGAGVDRSRQATGWQRRLLALDPPDHLRQFGLDHATEESADERLAVAADGAHQHVVRISQDEGHVLQVLVVKRRIEAWIGRGGQIVEGGIVRVERAQVIGRYQSVPVAVPVRADPLDDLQVPLGRLRIEGRQGGSRHAIQIGLQQVGCVTQLAGQFQDGAAFRHIPTQDVKHTHNRQHDHQRQHDGHQQFDERDRPSRAETETWVRTLFHARKRVLPPFSRLVVRAMWQHGDSLFPWICGPLT